MRLWPAPPICLPAQTGSMPVELTYRDGGVSKVQALQTVITIT